MTSTAAHEDAEREYVALMRAQRARAVVLVGSRSTTPPPGRRCAPNWNAFTRSGGRAACIGQNLLGVDTVLRRTGRAPKPWPEPSPRSVTGGSPCWPGRARC